jgi:hypothetical protein
MKWIVEDFHAELGYKNLCYELVKQGHEVKILTLEKFYLEDTLFYPQGERVLFQGSLNMAKTLLFKKYWTPTAWLNIPAYECTAYYPVFKDLLFNDKYEFITMEELRNNYVDYWKKYSSDDMMFLRPSSGMKSFGGSVETKEEFVKALGWRDNFVKSEDIIMVSTPKNILGEWRVVTDGKKVIAHSQYRYGGRQDIKQESREDKQMLVKAQEVIDIGYNPDPMWCFDICEDEDHNMWLLEIGSFSCSGLYMCDCEPIVKRASELALL